MTELEKKLTNALLMIRDHINEPEVITSIIDKNIGTDEDVMLDDKPADKPAENSDTKEPTDEEDHFGEGQADGMDEIRNILLGTKEGPNDNRW